MPQLSSPFLDHIVRFLMPFFLGAGADIDAAKGEILATLTSYGARTRSEVISAAQIIAFGLSTLDTLGEAKATEMSPSMRLRFRGCANGLNRSGQQNETSLARRLACDGPDVAMPVAEPANDVPDTEVQEMIQQARAKIDTYRNRLSGTRPAAGPHPASGSREERDKQLWGSAMMHALADMGMPVNPAPAS